MGAVFGGKTSSTNVLMIGLSGAGKTFMLYNCLLEEGWQDVYRLGPEYDDGEPKVKVTGN